MAITALKIPSNDGYKYINVVTAPLEGVDHEGISVTFRECDDQFKDTGKTDATIDPRDEETYHKQLREASAEHEHYVPAYSTNPEWNPATEHGDGSNSESDRAEGGSEES